MCLRMHIPILCFESETKTGFEPLHRYRTIRLIERAAIKSNLTTTILYVLLARST